jgi:hypothetical protein
MVPLRDFVDSWIKKLREAQIECQNKVGTPFDIQAEYQYIADLLFALSEQLTNYITNRDNPIGLKNGELIAGSANANVANPKGKAARVNHIMQVIMQLGKDTPGYEEVKGLLKTLKAPPEALSESPDFIERLGMKENWDTDEQFCYDPANVDESTGNLRKIYASHSAKLDDVDHYDKTTLKSDWNPRYRHLNARLSSIAKNAQSFTKPGGVAAAIARAQKSISNNVEIPKNQNKPISEEVVKELNNGNHAAANQVLQNVGATPKQAATVVKQVSQAAAGVGKNLTPIAQESISTNVGIPKNQNKPIAQLVAGHVNNGNHKAAKEVLQNVGATPKQAANVVQQVAAPLNLSTGDKIGEPPQAISVNQVNKSLEKAGLPPSNGAANALAAKVNAGGKVSGNDVKQLTGTNNPNKAHNAAKMINNPTKFPADNFNPRA